MEIALYSGGSDNAVRYEIRNSLIVRVYFKEIWNNITNPDTIVKGMVQDPFDKKTFTTKIHEGGFLVLERKLEEIIDKRKIKEVIGA